jgi:hypothetical protein
MQSRGRWRPARLRPAVCVGARTSPDRETDGRSSCTSC